MATWLTGNRHRRINEVLTKMNLPLHKGLVKIPVQVRVLEQFGIDVLECPCCKNKSLQLLKIFYPCLPAGRRGQKQVMDKSALEKELFIAAI